MLRIQFQTFFAGAASVFLLLSGSGYGFVSTSGKNLVFFVQWCIQIIQCTGTYFEDTGTGIYGTGTVFTVFNCRRFFYNKGNTKNQSQFSIDNFNSTSKR